MTIGPRLKYDPQRRTWVESSRLRDSVRGFVIAVIFLGLVLAFFG